jgi:hypothetical protein
MVIYMKKLLWTALVTGLVTVTTRYSLVAASVVWRKISGERPPRLPHWARAFVDAPVRRGLLAQLRG